MTDNVFETTTTTTPVIADQALVEKRLKDKDEYIARLEAENKVAREAAARADTLEANAEKLRQELLKAQTPTKVETNTTSVPEDKIRDLVKSTMIQTEAEKLTAINTAIVNDKLTKHFGTSEKAKEAIQATAAKLGVTVEYLKTVSIQSPNALFSMIGLDEQAAPVQVDTTRSVLNTQAQAESAVLQPGTKAYFENLRRTAPSKYWDKNTQIEIYNAFAKGTYKP